jgi:hypothetical protein
MWKLSSSLNDEDAKVFVANLALPQDIAGFGCFQKYRPVRSTVNVEFHEVGTSMLTKEQAYYSIAGSRRVGGDKPSNRSLRLNP